MNKKAEGILMSNVVYIIILVLFLAGMFWFVTQQKSGAGYYENYYVQEISRVIDMAQPGTMVTLDVQKATVVGKDAGMLSFSDMFQFNNAENEICVKLNSGTRKSCYHYFTNVNIEGVHLDLGIGKNGGNILTFNVVKK